MNPDEKRVLQKAQLLGKWNGSKLFYSIGRQHQRNWSVKRGEVYFVDLGQNVGSEENKIRPVVVIQANAYNFKSPVFTCAIISSSTMTIPDIQVPISGSYAYTDEHGTTQNLHGTIDLGQIKTVAKERIMGKRICTLSQSEMEAVDTSLFNALGLRNALTTRDNIIASLNGKVKYLQEQKNP